MRTASLLTSLLIMSSVALAQEPSVVFDRDEEARLSFELARRHYERGEFREAGEAFERSHTYAAHAELLYNAYLAYRDANDDVNAARTLRSYLEQVEETSESRVVLEQRLAALEAALTSEPLPPDEPGETEAHDSVSPAPQRSGPPVGAIILTAGGGAAVITGVITAIVTKVVQGDIMSACPDQTCSDLSAHQADIDRGRRLARTTDVLLFGGGALLVGGILWWVLGASGDDSSGDSASAANVSIMCAEAGCELGVRGSF